MKIPESGVAKVRSGTHRLLLLTSAAVPDDGRRLHNKQLVASRLPARGIECGAEDLDYELVGGCRDVATTSTSSKLRRDSRRVSEMSSKQRPPLKVRPLVS